MKIRLRLSSAIMRFGARLAPKNVRSAALAAAGLPYSLTEQVDKFHRTGGLVYMPWAIDEPGREIAERMFEATAIQTDKIRREVEPDGPPGVQRFRWLGEIVKAVEEKN